MKIKLITTLFLGFFLTITAQTPCENGFAGAFPCDGYDLMAHFNLSSLNAGAGNDSWGWVDPQDGKEYAIVCLDNGTAFFDISDPTDVVYVGKLPTQPGTGSSIWRDAKVYDNHVFVVSDSNPGHGMQVFDLTRLRNVANPPAVFDNDAHYDEFGSAHNIAINEETGYAYVIGSFTYNGGPHIINIQDPLNPVFAGGYGDLDYTHDAQVVVYAGPDEDYQGREILIGSNAYQIVIIDVTDKNNITEISTLNYTNVAYTHQGWLTEDHRFFILGDELDEVDFGFNTRTLVFDFTDLDNPQFKFSYSGATEAIDHNLYVKGDKMYLANYAAGLRVFDISGIESNTITPDGYFDSHPENNGTDFKGAWNVYPFFESGNIIISDMNRGFLLVRPSDFSGTENYSADIFQMFPNPAADYLTIKSKNEPINTLEVYNLMGQQLLSYRNQKLTGKTIDVSGLPSGMYIVKVNDNTSRKFIKK